MFEGVQDQFTAPLPPSQISYHPLSFSLLHASVSSSPPSPFPFIFDNYPSQSSQMMQHSVELQYPEPAKSAEQGLGEVTSWFGSKSLDELHPDELVALSSLRSAMDNCFPADDHVSRKLEDIGFRRRPHKCKEKFEEESRSHIQKATTINADQVMSCPAKNYRLFSELEEFYRHGCEEVLEKEDDEHQRQHGLLDINDGSAATDYHHQITIDEVEEDIEGENKNVKSSHHHNKKFKIFKSLCKEIVNKMMVHQEELHNKILQDLMKRDKENIAMEEAWKKQEMVRVNKEMEARAKDRAMICDRQAKIIEFLHKFISDNNNNSMIINNNGDDFNLPISSTHQSPSSSAAHSTSLNCHIPPSSNDENHESLSQTSNSITAHIDPIPPTSKYNKMRPNSQKARPKKRVYEDDDIGKRWPREEVIALINIRCNLHSSNNTRPDIVHDESNKNSPLWERISTSMKELGYNRSARRCKEKWENINKYFRKTKDSKKKRPADSRTCPYFQQLNHLYSIGRTSNGSNGVSGFNYIGDDTTFQAE